MLKHRRIEPEVMDDPTLDAGRHRLALRGLGRLNRFSGSAHLVYHALRRLILNQKSKIKNQKSHPHPLRVLDIATGGGDVVIDLRRLARRDGLGWRIDGCDVSPVALGYARRRAAAAGEEAGFFPLDALNDPLPAGYDVVTCSLFLHHLREEDAVELLRKMAGAARRGIVVNDLRRSAGGLATVYLASRLLSRCDVVHTDGPRSVRAALTIDEAGDLARRAGLREARIEPRFPCRYLMTWSRK